MHIEITPATFGHIRELLCELKGLNEDDAYRFGADSEEILLQAFRKSIFMDAGFVNGRLVGVYGVIGEYLGYEGRPWSLLSPEAEKYPFRLTTFYRKALNKMLQLFPVLVDVVDARHEKVLRMLKIMGFEFEKPHFFMGRQFIKATWGK